MNLKIVIRHVFDLQRTDFVELSLQWKHRDV